MPTQSRICLLAWLALVGCTAAEPDLEIDEPELLTTEQALAGSPDAACVPPHDVWINDPQVWHGSDFFGFSENTLRGPRDCGGQRMSRSVNQVYGTGWCDVVSDWSDPAHPIFWANELCARDPNMQVGNSTIAQACQDFSNGGSDLGDGDCRYIVHIGGPQYVPPFDPANETLCQPSHVTRAPESCPPPPPLCPTGYKCCEFSDDHTSCDLCVRKHLYCP